MSQQSHLQSLSPKPRYQISTPRLSAALMLALLREAGVPESEARRRIDSDPTLAADSTTDVA
ncbi:MAG TPA: hypothetical protein VFS67_10835 [Polyangiaceae bacterium]|jgi:hypothetical protein|nr:hypothetical protein [Polyangiaceae bacterium]